MRYTETIEIGDERGGVQEEEMAQELSARGFARVQTLDAALGDARSYLSFQERVEWAESDADLDALVKRARARQPRA